MKKYLFIALAALGFAACEKSADESKTQQNAELEQSYVAITLAADDMTRADDGKYEEGRAEERTVKSAYVFFFEDGAAFPVTFDGTTSTNAGVQNYIKAFQDENFRYSFGYTAVFAVISLVLINVLAFAVAYALTQKIKGANLFRTVFFMPNLIGGIVLGYIWSMIFDGFLDMYQTSILTNTTWGFWGLIILMCWQQIGYMMIIYIAGLQAVPENMLEAARIDGANGWQTLFKVTIPNVMPSITICMFLTLTNSFKLFDQNLALTDGQPYIINPDGSSVHTTEMLALNIYNTFYGQNVNSRGVAQAKAVLFFILVASIGLLQLRATRNKEVQQ